MKPFSLALVALATLTSCGAGDPSESPGGDGEPAGAAAAQTPLSRLARWRSAFSAIEPAASFRATEQGAVLAGPLSQVELAGDARGQTSLIDRASGLRVAFSLTGASAAPLSVDGGHAIYPGAGPEGADVLVSAGRSGIEDFVAFERPPAREVITYSLDTGNAAGLRLVEGALEILDAGGAPRLRVSAPDVIEESGRRVAATLEIDGCVYDTDPSAPWGRPVLAPGAPACLLRVSWEGKNVRYPALVDPAWSSTTNTLVASRIQATATLINPSSKASPVLITGGYDTAGSALATAEIYEPLSRTFALTGSMAAARGGHSAVGLSLSSKGRVLVSGGLPSQSSQSPLESFEVYDPDTGKFGAVKNGANDLKFPQDFGRSLHATTLLADGVVLITGGAILLNQPTNTTYVLTYSPPSASTLAPAGGMSQSRAGHTATRLPNGQVLVVGGYVLSQSALKLAELYNPVSTAFDPIAPLGLPPGGNPQQMKELRAFHTANLIQLSDPDPMVQGDEEAVVVISGGVSSLIAGAQYSNTVEVYEHRTSVRGFSALISGVTKRARHTTTPLPTGDLLLAGGVNDTGTLNAVDVLRITPPVDVATPTTGQFVTLDPPLPPLGDARHSHIAAAVNAGEDIAAGQTVMVAGGSGVTGPLASAEVLIRDLGEKCTIDAECLSGFCVDGVCCNTACDTECYSCSAAEQAPADPGVPGDPGETDGLCRPQATPVPGTVVVQGELYPGELPTECNGLAEIHFKCDGKGLKVEAETFPCLPSACGASKEFCELTCNCNTAAECAAQAAPKQCFAKGWCLIPDGQPEGECQNKGGLGTPCSQDYECSANTFCVDGVCCNSECKDQCAACNLTTSPGLCSPVGKNGPTPVVTGGAANRTPCNGDGTACSGFCEGLKTDECVYPGNMVPASDPSCACENDDCTIGPAIVTSYLCDGNGGETTSDTTCGGGGIRCAPPNEMGAVTACLAECKTDDDCFKDYYCDAGGQCALLPDGGRCHESDPTLLREKGKDPQSCGDYICQPHENDDGGECLTSCTKKSDCTGELSCNTDGQCVAGPAEVPVTASCSAAPARTGVAYSALVGALLAVAAGLARRRKPA